MPIDLKEGNLQQLPLNEAQISDVIPRFSVAFTSAPLSIKSWTTYAWPECIKIKIEWMLEFQKYNFFINTKLGSQMKGQQSKIISETNFGTMVNERSGNIYAT